MGILLVCAALVIYLEVSQAFISLLPRQLQVQLKNLSLRAYQDVYGDGEDGSSGLDRELRGDISYITLMAPLKSKKSGLPERTKDSKFKFTSESLSDKDFGDIFRTCAPYIARHRAEGCVIHIPGHVIEDVDLLDEIMTDVSILHLLGVHLVLVMGVREQLERKLTAAGISMEMANGIRVTDERTLSLLKESCGLARYEIERSLTRAFSGQQSINVVSGNSFYTAKPIGVREGVDYINAGEVRRVESDNIKRRLQDNDIILLSPVGYSNSGESFSVMSEDLAAAVASGIGANKVVFYSEGEALIDRRTKKRLASLRLAQAGKLMESLSGGSQEFTNDVSFSGGTRGGNIRKIEFGVRDRDANEDAFSGSGRGFESMSARHDGSGSDGSATMPGMMVSPVSRFRNAEQAQPSGRNLVFSPEEGTGSSEDYNRWVVNHMKLLSRCVYALNGGVERAHVIKPDSGSLIKELYSRDGSGILICRDVYEGVRNAESGDVAMIEEILAPLVEQQIMVPRSRAQLEDELSNLFVLTRDGAILACGMLKIHEGNTHGEICCIAVHPKYRREGRGETILAYLERRALSMGVKTVFLLSTRTMGWFQERGYRNAPHTELPPTKPYDPDRGSKVYMKKLNNIRDLDSEELLWRLT